MTERPRRPLHVHVGSLGWGNRKGGLEAYGSEGRWGGHGDHADHGDLLGDALERDGCTEGSALIVVAVPRFPKHELPEVESAVRAAVEGLDQ